MAQTYAEAKEEAAKTAGDDHTPQYDLHPAIAAAVEPAMPSDMALSFRELEEVKKEEERKEQERAAARRKLSQASQQETQESEPPKRPPQPVQGEDEQRQQRMVQNGMNLLTEQIAEQVRVAAAAKSKKYGWKKRGGTKY